MNQVETYDKVIDRVEQDFTAIAPPTMQFRAERGYAMQILQNNSYLLGVAEKNPISLMQAIRNVAAIGLSLNPAKKQAYLIPRKVKIDNNYVDKIFLEPSYMGLCDIATGIGSIQWVQAKCVYANDVFVDNGPGQAPTHTYNAFSKERGEFVGVYCTAKTIGGDFLTTIMDKAQIEAIRDKSESWKRGQSGPWKDFFEEQAKKTVVRNAYKMWPKGANYDRLATAVQLSNDNEGIEFTTSPELSSYTVEQKTYFDSLITSSDAVRMHIFMSSLDSGVQTSLFNSFEKGGITKYKNAVRELMHKGHQIVVDVIAAANDAAETGDDLAIKELWSDLPQEARDHVLKLVSAGARKFIMAIAA